MKTPKAYIFLPSAILAIAVSVGIARIASTGAPESSTGGPGERTCATGGCHDDHAINTGTGSVALNVGLPGTIGYLPGRTYPITVSIHQDSLVRFGFQIVALTESEANNAGEIMVTDSARTHSFFGSVFFPTRRYITYTFEGTDAVSTGNSQWTFQWKAPDTNVGNVRFYCGAVGANNDGTDQGDFAYTIAKTLSYAGSSAVHSPHSPATVLDNINLDLR